MMLAASVLSNLVLAFLLWIVRKQRNNANADAKLARQNEDFYRLQSSAFRKKSMVLAEVLEEYRKKLEAKAGP